ncbi:MAG: hypothetical protein ABS81_13595 [Pseudonocardia sp. SCN 72-86]|nr:MAG: hypothetical protein ABS81_13595 [Pseudonocardia sp. SCN 72-86]
MTPRIACTVRPWTKLPLERALRGIAAAGFDAVALPVHGVEEVITPATPPAEASAIGEQIASHGLDLVVLSHAAALDGTDDEALAALRGQLEHCARLGVDTLVDMGTTVPEHYDRYVALMRAGAPVAADLGVRIGVKPHGGLTRTCDDLLTLLDRVDHDAFRICLDPGNLVHHAGEAPLDDMARIAPHVIAVGVRDHPGRGRPGGDAEGMPPPITPGDGAVDLAGMFAALRATGFTGPAAVESLTPQPTPEGTDAQAVRALAVVTALAAGDATPAPERGDRYACADVATGTDESLGATARVFDRYLLVETPLPWPPGMGRPLAEYPQIPDHLRDPLARADAVTAAAGLTMKPLALSPDPDHSEPGHTRVMRFDRVDGPSTGYVRVEYVVPDAEAGALIDALFGADPSTPDRFATWRRDDPTRRDLVVCTHATVDACCGRLGYPLYRAVRDRIGADHPVRVWRISSFGGHRFAPVAIDLPEGRFWGRLTPDVAVAIADRSGTAADVAAHYRGWGVLDLPHAQAVERELLAAEGWSWTGRDVAVSVVDDQDPDRIELRVTAGPGPDSEPPAEWDAVVEIVRTDEVMVGCVGPFAAMPRYRVAKLDRR